MRMSVLEKTLVNRQGHTRKVAARAMNLLNRIDHPAGSRYLDVGCGVGAAAREISTTSQLHVTGVDVDPKQIHAAQVAGESSNLHFQVMDATRLEFGDGEFDIVASSMATHHIPNWERAISEMARVLRRGGYLIYSDFAFWPWLARIARRIIRFVGFPTSNALDSLAADAGLVKVYQSAVAGKTEAIWIKQ